MTPNMMMSLIAVLTLVNLGAIATTTSVMEDRLSDRIDDSATADAEVQPDPIGNSFAIFIKFDGIDGESKDADHDKWIDVLSISHGRTSVSDPITGMPTGEIGSGSMVIVKELDKSSPKLAQVLTLERALDMEFDVLESNPPQMTRLISGTLVNATIASIRTMDHLHHTGEEETGSTLLIVEEVTLNYEKVTWTFSDGSLEHTDDWIAARGLDPDDDDDGIPTEASFSAYIKIGDIKGESKDKGHKDEIDVLAWSWGLNQPGGGQTGQARQRASVTLGDVVVVKELDKASPKIAEAISHETPIGDAILYITKTDEPGTDPMPYMTIELENVTLASARRPLDPATVTQDLARTDTCPHGLRVSGFPGSAAHVASCGIDTTTPVETVEFDFAFGNITYHGAGMNGTDMKIAVLPWMAPESITSRYYIKFDGVDGEAKDKGREDTFVLRDFEYRVNGGPMDPYSMGRQSEPIRLTKRIDKASPLLMSSLNDGMTFNATVYADEMRAMEDGSVKRTEYLMYELKNALVTSYSTGGSGGEDSVIESFSLNYEEVRTTYVEDGNEYIDDWEEPLGVYGVDMFLDIEGEVFAGDSRVAGHKDEIDVLAWSWGTTSGLRTGGGGGGGKINVEDLSFTKYIDKSSPALMEAFANGDIIGNATLTMYRSGESEPFMSTEMISMSIVSIDPSTGNTFGPDQFKNKGKSNLYEEITIKPIRLELAYHDAGPQGGDVEVSFDVEPREVTTMTEVNMTIEGLGGSDTYSRTLVSFEHITLGKTRGGVHSGKLSGVRMHSPFVISSQIDNISPIVHRAMVDGESDFNVTIDLIRVASSGERTTYFRYKLTDVIVTSYTTGAGDGGDFDTEIVSLNYGKIQWEYVEAGIIIDETGIFEQPPASAIFIKIGDIKGESKDRDHVDWIDVLSVDWGISSPRDAASGLPTGKRQHKPVTLTKAVDKASPKLQEMLSSGDAEDIAFELYTADENGTLQHDITINLTGAELLSMEVDHRGHVTVLKSAETGGHVTVLKAWEHRGHVTVLKNQEEAPASVEMLTLRYEEIQVTYEQAADSFFDVWTDVYIPPSVLAFAKFEGIDGESKDDRHEDWSDLASFQWVINEYLEPDTGRPTGILEAQDVIVTKWLDKASPALTMNIASGETFNVTIEQFRANESSATGMDHVLTIDLWNASVMRVSAKELDKGDPKSPEAGDSSDGEVIVLSFQTLDITWELQDRVIVGIGHPK